MVIGVVENPWVTLPRGSLMINTAFDSAHLLKMLDSGKVKLTC